MSDHADMIDAMAEEIDALKQRLSEVEAEREKEIEQACAAERAEIAFDIAENPNSEWTRELRESFALNNIGRTAPERMREALNIERMRANLHATFNGGWQNEREIEAFHHGMDTVCNVLESHLKGEQTNWILPAALSTPRQP